MDEKPKVCAHISCRCQIKPGEGVRRSGEIYCCHECADGDGCDHEGCQCEDEQGETD